MQLENKKPVSYILLGYMGSGKSTVGQVLASLTSLPFIDLDDYIEAQESMSISQIIAQKGIIYFRKQELLYLKSVLKRRESIVLSLGGGTPCYYNNMELINEKPESRSIYLRANVPFLTQRLFEERQTRPLIAGIDNRDELAEFIGKHLLERSAFYNQAHNVVEIENKTPQAIALEILDLA
ncbi:shikimate kinase [Nonlabens sp. YIK11]|uniref:shikimate kinase n=1 Tax=Nonlabens sp. YIK11 TaxID=1453349 RepID=UPI000B1D4F4D|nr:shikimate kinase [Nonlabens sp. YIK11]